MSDKPAPAPAPPAAAKPAAAVRPTVDPREAVKWHGIMLAGANLPLPTCTYKTDELARKQYTNITGSEFCDTPEVLDIKVDLLIKLLRESPRTAILNGAGSSITAKSDLPQYAGVGIRDYATKNAASAPQKSLLKHELIQSLRPTMTHRALAQMLKDGHIRNEDTSVPMLLDQCHDGLFCRGGIPRARVNQLHGTWVGDAGYRKENKIIKMSGTLRSDLCQQLYDLEKILTFTLVTGSSLSGLNADRLYHTACERFIKKEPGQLGGALISIQQTPHDQDAALRIFAKLDDVFALVAEKLKLEIDWTTDYDFMTGKPMKLGLPVWMRGGTGPTSKATGAAAAAASSSAAARSPSNRSPSNRSPSRSPPRMYPEENRTPPRIISPSRGSAQAPLRK